ncbi:MAG: prolyl oligopeptidase family serine peptidase [Mariniblastus sp.]
MAKIKCPDCDKVAKVKLRKKPFKAQCPRCKRVLRIPALQQGEAQEENDGEILAPLSPLAPGQAPLAPLQPPPMMPARPPQIPNQAPPAQPYAPPSLAAPELFPPPMSLENQFSQAAPLPSASPIPVASVAKGAGRLAAAQPKPKRKKKRSSSKPNSKSLGGLQIAAISVVIVTLLGLLVGGGIMMFSNLLKAEPIIAFEEGLNAIPVPTPLPDLEGYDPETNVNSRRFDITLPNNNEPGGGMQMRVLIPEGKHELGSLPCILVAPAGTMLLHGSELYDPGSESEFLPYVQAGMVVIHYSIDGNLVENNSASLMAQTEDERFTQQLSRAYPKFRFAGAGAVNGRNAIEYAIQKVKVVDASRIYSAGHSSAGTLSLLLASQDSRIKGCIAYAPAYDLEERMAEFLADPNASMLLPGLKDFVRDISPKNFVANLKCRTFIFHAKDDDNVPYSDAEAFTSQLKGQGTPLSFVMTQSGGHYFSMVEEGIPAAIGWINNGGN